MVMLNPYMAKTAIGKTAGQTLELEANSGEAFLVKNIMVGNNDAEFLDLTIDKAMVGRWRTAKTLGNHLSFPLGAGKHSHDLVLDWTTAAQTVDGKYEITDALGNTIATLIAGDGGADLTGKRALAYEAMKRPEKTLMQLLGDRGHFSGYPIPEGQKLVLSPSNTAQYLGNVLIEYERYEAGDIKSDMENGSEAREYLFLNYGDVGSAITTKGDYLLNTVNSPTEFPDFPIGKDVPAKTEIDLIGICASEAYDYDTANDYTLTNYIKLVRDRTTLFDEDRKGLLFLGHDAKESIVGSFYGEGFSVVGNYSTVDTKLPWFAPGPITFMAGEELNAYIVADEGSGAAGSIAQAGSEVAFIEMVRKVS